jgi:putative NIF3 family GTP cyclohydrolase 1 type 2
MLLRDLLKVLEEIAPTRDAESWDNVGLLVGDPGQAVTKALLAIDYTPGVAEEAKREGCDLVIAYHPPLFSAIKRLTAPDPIFDAIRRGVALYSPHTALDVADGGTNDLLADILGLQDRQPLRLIEPKARNHKLTTFVPEEHLERVANALFEAGAGREHLKDAIAQRAKLYLTGEIPHHEALAAAKAGMTVVATLHSNSERATLKRLRDRLAEATGAVPFLISSVDRDPFQIL